MLLKRTLVALLFAWRSLPEPARHESLTRRGVFGGGLRHALATPTLPLVIALQFVATFAFANFEGTLSLLTKVKWGYDPTHNGFLFSYVGICLLVFQGAVVRRLMPRVGELNFVVAGSLILAGGLVGVALAATTNQVLAVLPFAVLGFSMLTPSLASLLSRRTPASMQGEVLGLGQSSLALARILGPFVGITLMGIRHPTPGVTEAATAERPYWLPAAAPRGAVPRAPRPPAAPGGDIAQSVEQLTFNQRVAGSSPAVPTSRGAATADGIGAARVREIGTGGLGGCGRLRPSLGRADPNAPVARSEAPRGSGVERAGCCARAPSRTPRVPRGPARLRGPRRGHSSVGRAADF